MCTLSQLKIKIKISVQRKYKYGTDHDDSFQKPLVTEPIMNFKIISLDSLSCESGSGGRLCPNSGMLAPRVVSQV